MVRWEVGGGTLLWEHSPVTRDFLLDSHLLKGLPLPNSTTLGTYPDPLVGYCGHFAIDRVLLVKLSITGALASSLACEGMHRRSLLFSHYRPWDKPFPILEGKMIMD